MEVQKVEVLAGICGDYAAWHEVGFSVEYDYTNDTHINNHYSMEEIDEMSEEGHDGDYSDTQLIGGYLIDVNIT